MPRRVRRNKTQEDLYKALKEGEAGVFESYKDVFMMAAAIGFKHGRRTPFESFAEPIELDVFSGKTDLPVINAIALQETQDVTILLEDDGTYERKLNIVEEYANGGMEILKQHLLDSTGDPLDNLITLIYEQHNPESREDDPLETMVESLGF